MKPRYSAPVYNEFPPIKHANFGPRKHFHIYFFIGYSENLGLEHNFDQSLEMRYIGVQLYSQMVRQSMHHAVCLAVRLAVRLSVSLSLWTMNIHLLADHDDVAF